MQNAIAVWVTRILNPLIIPSLTFLLLVLIGTTYTSNLAPGSEWLLPLLVFGTTFALPATIFLLFIKMGYIKDPEMSNRYERILPSIVTAIFFYGTYYLLHRIQIHPVLNYFMLSATLLVILCMAVTYFWKISLHMSAMGAMTGTFVGLSFLTLTPMLGYIILSAALSGLVGFARLRLNAHNPAQVYAGWLLGFILLTFLFGYQSL